MLGYREASLSWLPIFRGDKPPPHAVQADRKLYVIRSRHKEDVLPGKWAPHVGHITHLPYDGVEIIVSTFEVLCDTGLYSGKSGYRWIPAEGRQISPNVFEAGLQKDGTPLSVARA
ncbi:hypothetical protein CRM22_004090 [Opisthorchis felineus]|uniref:Uncharacterized protein n=1 Tax=Opisthorchis felineus TaxID=147828 RepID=A0A4S2LYN6_OPIFE|nr:hypothetical protein CRM22_004090 [Opisthorchis felineus]